MVSKERKPYRSPEQIVAVLEAKIANVRARGERKALNADPGRKHAKLGLAALRRAVKDGEDPALVNGLQEIVPQVERCLGVESPPAQPRKV